MFYGIVGDLQRMTSYLTDVKPAIRDSLIAAFEEVQPESSKGAQPQPSPAASSKAKGAPSPAAKRSEPSATAAQVSAATAAAEVPPPANMGDEQTCQFCGRRAVLDSLIDRIFFELLHLASLAFSQARSNIR